MAGLTPSVDKLLALIEHKQDDLVSLTRALVQIPTINPPGDNYADCIELLKSRLSTRGFQIEIIRAEGTPGDTDRYPRLNLMREEKGTGLVLVFTSTRISMLFLLGKAGTMTLLRLSSGMEKSMVVARVI